MTTFSCSRCGQESEGIPFGAALENLCWDCHWGPDPPDPGDALRQSQEAMGGSCIIVKPGSPEEAEYVAALGRRLRRQRASKP